MDVEMIRGEDVKWRKIRAEDLNLDYAVIFQRSTADKIFQELENTLEYFSGELSKVRVFGRWHQIPRQHVSYGDPKITYNFSGRTIPTLPWPKILENIRDKLHDLCGYRFDFVLINRYKDGTQHIGEHRDDEPELDHTAPIASISLGQIRTFTLKHRDARKKTPEKRDIPPVKIDLEHGSLLLMNPPTNQIWYHSLPIRKSAKKVRINMTFRKHKFVQ